MGAGIAEVCAVRGADVVVVEVVPAALEAGQSRIEASLGTAVARGKISEGDRDAALGRLRFSDSYDELGDRQLVIEAVTEREDVKLSVFQTLDKVVPADGLLASNTSSIPITRLAVATGRPDQVCGLHFFNPAPVMPLVEVVSTLLTSDATREAATAFVAGTLGKSVVQAKDRAGFVVNALLVPYMLSAVRMLESGFATKEDIDTGMVKGCGHPMGPLTLGDMVGLDILYGAALSMYEEFKEPLYAPPPLLSRMIEAGHLGRKTGRGFYTYE